MNMKRSSRSNIVITWLIFIEVFTLILTENPSNSEQKKKTKKRVFYSVYPLSYVTTVFDDETGITANSNRYSNSAATMKLKRLAGTAYNQLKGLIKRND